MTRAPISSFFIRTSHFELRLSKQLLLKRPLPLSHPPPLHQNTDFFSDAVRQHEAPCILALLAHAQRIADGIDFQLVERCKKLMIGGAQGQEKFGLAIEEKRPKTRSLAGALKVCEIDVRGQILSAGVGEQVARDS